MLLKKISLDHLLIFLFASCAGALTMAYISQYVFDFQPCILCLYQRKPFFAIAALSILAIFLVKNPKIKKILFFICLGLLALNFAIASYHVGVEQKIFRGPSTCSSTNLNDITDLAELEKALQNTKAVRCDEPNFFFLGLTMAAWNAIFCLALSIATFAIYRKNI